VPQLRDLAKRRDYRVEIYNGGVGGTGFFHFARLLESVESELDFGRIAVPFITHDVYRANWRPHEQDGRIFLCPTWEAIADCVRERPINIWVLSDTDLPSDRIPDWLHERGLSLGSRNPFDWFIRHTFAGMLLRRSLALDHEGDPRGLREPVGKILKRFRVGVAERRVTFLHIPERDETRRGRYRGDPSTAIRAAGYEYVALLAECGFQRRDYFDVDPHFNADGYDKLRTCVGRALDLL
jgi:hypothetical protein